MVASIALIADCDKPPSEEPSTPTGSETGTCYHPTDGGICDNAAECAKHNGTWGRNG
ncbi:MAG: hypothetical protein OEW27_13640 [Aquincola sp.]|nr:hypothetical protein [Aquincola sp.]MDH5330983.1 hypothetical protein [Aquincola sp.]